LAVDPSRELESSTSSKTPAPIRIRRRGGRTTIVSHLTLHIRFSASSPLSSNPDALQALASALGMSGDDVEFGHWEDIVSGRTLECRASIRDIDVDGLDRGHWMVHGALGTVSTQLVFEVEKATYVNELGTPWLGSDPLVVHPRRVVALEAGEPLDGLALEPDEDRGTDDPFLAAARRYVDHAEDVDDRRAAAAATPYQLVDQWWRCGVCRSENNADTPACAQCRSNRGDSPFTHARVRLTSTPPYAIRVGDQVTAHLHGVNQPVMTLESIRADSCELRFRRREPLSEFGELRPTVNHRLYEAQRDELNAIADGAYTSLARVLRFPRSLTMAEPAPARDRAIMRTDFNQQQREALVQIAGMAEGDIYLIQGPPGTGKTTAIVEAMAQLTANGHRVVLASHSNEAVDTGQGRLRSITTVRQARLGEASRVGEDAADLIANDQVLLSFNVLAGTTARLTVDDRLLDLDIDWLFLDEANKVRFHEALPLMARAKRWVLIGDPNQLGPVQDEASSGFEKDDEASTVVASSSLYEWLWTKVPLGCRTTLLTQYRMRAHIGGIVSDLFYGKQLINAGPKTTILRLGFPLDRDVVWIDTGRQKEARGSGNSLRNPFEVAVCADIARIINERRPTTTVAVISMYADQVEQLKRAIAPILPDAKVATVDAFEGREAEAVILSLVRSNDTAQVGFLDDWHRVNVAMSRAQILLAIIGDLDTIAKGSPHVFAKVRAEIQRRDKLDGTRFAGAIRVAEACERNGLASDVSALLGARPVRRGSTGMPLRHPTREKGGVGAARQLRNRRST
jgi:RecA/RadA recombinase